MHACTRDRRVRNMNQRCYTGEHLDLFVPLGVVAVLALVLGPPLVLMLVLWRHRRTLHEEHTAQMYGFLFHRYRYRGACGGEGREGKGAQTQATFV